MFYICLLRFISNYLHYLKFLFLNHMFIIVVNTVKFNLINYIKFSYLPQWVPSIPHSLSLIFFLSNYSLSLMLALPNSMSVM